MTPKIAEWSNMSAGRLAGVLLAAGGAGVGARLLRHAYDLSTGRDVNPPAPLAQVTPAAAPIPVHFTAEEAAELERNGVHVKRRPAVAAPAELPKVAGTFLDNLALSVGGTAAAYGGWKALDSTLDSQRRAAQQKKLDAVRTRIAGLLNNTPAPLDAPLHAQMKAAEDVFFASEKTASIGGWLGEQAGSGLLNIASPLAIPIGIAGTALGLSAYNESRKNNKFEQTAKALRRFYEARKPRLPEAEIEPYTDEVAPVTQPMGGPKVAALREVLRQRMAA